MAKIKLLGPFKELISMRQLPIKGGLKDECLECVQGAGVVVQGDKILKLGKYQELDQGDGIEEKFVMEGDKILLPGFVDAHTHICFAGSRANDFALRNGGSSYLEIAKAGGGIWDTVGKTRLASESALVSGIRTRVDRLMDIGVTTCEVKSGYGLSVREELKMLNAIKLAESLVSIDLIPTCLAAHIFPKDYHGTIEAYIDEIAETLFPELKRLNLTNRVDAFIEEEAFNEQVITPYFKKAQQMGFDLTVHADQFSPGGSALAVKYEAKSADHLEASGPKEIEMLANSEVVSVALPGASIGIGCPFTPARKILDAGGSLAIASDWNPGSAPMGDLLTQACILATFQKLSNAEVLAGITFRAAAALGLTDRGRIDVGQKADFIMFDAKSYKEITYQQGSMRPTEVWKNGMKIR